MIKTIIGLGIGKELSIRIIPELQAIMMERIAHPRGAKPERRDGLIIL
jgi:hypothetical protein